MPIRITCPSCDAKMSVGDNLAGKAIKCPKCLERVHVPAPEPDDEGFEVVDEPVAAKTIRAAEKPARISSRDDDDFEEEEDDRPRKPRKSGRRRSSRRRPTPKLTSAPMLIGIVSAIVLIPTLIFAFVMNRTLNKANDAFQAVGENFKNQHIFGPTTEKATLENYHKLNLGVTTEFDTWDIIAIGRPVLAQELSQYHLGRGVNNTQRFRKYVEDFNCHCYRSQNAIILAGFVRTPGVAGERLKCKAISMTDGTSLFEELSDADFETKAAESPFGSRRKKTNPLPPDEQPFPPRNESSTQEITLTADELSAQYRIDEAAANKKFKGKQITISGPVAETTAKSDAEVTIGFKVAAGMPMVSADSDKPNAVHLLDWQAGQVISVKGMCAGISNGSITLENSQCLTIKLRASPFFVASAFLNGYSSNPSIQDASCKDKYLAMSLVFEAKDDDGNYIFTANPSPVPLMTDMKIKVIPGKTWDLWFANYKPGLESSIRGRCMGIIGGKVVFEDVTPTSLQQPPSKVTGKQVTVPRKKKGTP